jgi:predicted DNA-binding transcriptional regulator AlpA
LKTWLLKPKLTVGHSASKVTGDVCIVHTLIATAAKSVYTAPQRTQVITHDKFCGLLSAARMGKNERTQMMKNYEFSIIASGLDPKAGDFESRFYDAGCDDATISLQKGHIIVDFARDSASMEAAVSSAIDAVIKAGAKVERVEPDPLVSLSEIAARVGMTRAAITQYSKGQRSKDFPAPVVKVTSDSPLWDWAAVSLWFFRHRKLSKEVALEALTVKEINSAIACGQTRIGAVVKKRVADYASSL